MSEFNLIFKMTDDGLLLTSVTPSDSSTSPSQPTLDRYKKENSYLSERLEDLTNVIRVACEYLNCPDDLCLIEHVKSLPPYKHLMISREDEFRHLKAELASYRGTLSELRTFFDCPPTANLVDFVKENFDFNDPMGDPSS